MILEQETLDKYGYSSIGIPYKEYKKLVVCQCGYCPSKYDIMFSTTKKKTWEAICPSCSQARAREAHMKKYGVDNPFKLKVFQDKAKETMQKKYGVDNISYMDGIREKASDTMFEKYGVRHSIHCKTFKDKRDKTMMDRYGVLYPIQNDDIHKKMMETMMREYNTTCGRDVCIKTGNNTTESMLITELNGFGCNFVPTNIPNSRLLLDGYDETLKIAIEYNGLHWHHEHSREPRGRNYHHNKMKLCMDSGIRLISIFSDEYLFRKKQVLGFLRAALGKCGNKVYARCVKLVEITDKTAQSFYEEYHIQGRTTKGTKSAGLYHNDVLIGAMTFGKHHRGKDGLVLTRLCFKDDWCVVGGASRLFKFLCKETNAESVISWSDNRWSIGGVYESLGFIKDEELGPDYSYVDIQSPKKRISKQTQMKKLTGCPHDKKEHEWSLENGLSRIWDCGKIRWKWTQNK